MYLTEHASIRWRQRAMSDDVFYFILENHDAEVYLGRDDRGRARWALRISDQLAAELLESDDVPIDVVEGARGTAVLVGEDDAVITIVKGAECRRFKALTRTGKRRRRPRWH